MKKLYILLFALLVSAIICEAQDVTKTAKMSLDAASIDRFDVNATSGFLIIEGDENASSIQVQADITRIIHEGM